MPIRAYYTDSYTREFAATAVEVTEHDGHPAVVLDSTYFYPSSGGQPHDTGMLNDANVVDVIVRDADNAVLHLLDRPLSPGPVVAVVDWLRRFDHMQQHSGQHILSQAFIRVANAETVGFHLGSDGVTIDLNSKHITTAQVEAAETLSNDIIVANVAIAAWFPAADEIPALPLRKTPDVAGDLRVVAIGEFDVTACGGTHVARTGELGLLKVVGVGKRSGGLARIEFRVGRRALADYGTKHRLVSELAESFSTAVADVPAAVAKLRDEHKALRRGLAQANEALLTHEAPALLAAASQHSGYRLVQQSWPDRDANTLRKLAAMLTAEPGLVALLGTAGQAQLVLARSDDLPHDMRKVLPAALGVLGSERGGGRPNQVQGGGVDATQSTVDAALAAAAAALEDAA